MLDTDHPQTKHIFGASALEDTLLGCAQQMPLLPHEERDTLLAKCATNCDVMRQLNRNAFKDAPFLTAAINEAQAALERLAQTGDKRDLDQFWQARAKLESPQGFGTCFI